MERAPAHDRHEEDRQLVARMLGGDQEAFADFSARYFSALYRFALSRLGDGEGARDAVQATLARVLPRLATYRGEAALLTWLCACCRNEILMLQRRLRSAPAEVELSDAAVPAAGFTVAGEGDPEELLLRRESAARVHVALDALPSHYARALEWKYVERLRVDEIAERLQLGPKAAESLLSRARRAFREQLENVEAGVASPPFREQEELAHGPLRARSRS